MPSLPLVAMAVLGPEKRYIYILGGQDDMEDVMLKLNRLYSLDTKTWTWYEPNVQGPKPVGRMFGSAVFLNNESYAVFAFGQETLGIYSNDIDNIVTGEAHNASEIPSDSSFFGGGAIAGIVIRMIHFSLWNLRNDEPRWFEACRLALKALLLFLFMLNPRLV
ncbi:hypothetical protein O0I10_009599 [Lichtheimia ornata]|uniref:Uncharacterized protein n=1 Tax=Lichtheimia ornata TaxID=688661 RepID=A0AAD7XS14_9FUNG|nr:uncharacterized protein O0I10_009599 [Lichtheimia ornata]KAJ8654709.1 hypothetical protein O0I10_009599 [Lichtheimia ornata]